MDIKTAPSLSPILETLLLRYGGLAEETSRTSRCLRNVAHAVKALSDCYTHGGITTQDDILSDPALLRAYVLYYLPVNLVKIFAALDELACAYFTSHQIKGHINLLDLGCGPGTYTLGLLEYIQKNSALFSNLIGVSWLGLDRSQTALEAATHLVADYSTHMCMPTSVISAGSFRKTILDPVHIRRELSRYGKPFHMVIIGNVLTELSSSDIQPLLREIVSWMTPEGIMIIIEPGTRTSFRKLLTCRDVVVTHALLDLYAPCLRSGLCPLASHGSAWCHALLQWEPPKSVALLDSVLPFHKHKGLAYSYLVATKQPSNRLEPYAVEPAEYVWRVISTMLHHRGEERCYVCDGVTRVLLRRLKKHASTYNAAFSRVRRGDLLCIQGSVDRGHFFDITGSTRVRRLWPEDSMSAIRADTEGMCR